MTLRRDYLFLLTAAGLNACVAGLLYPILQFYANQLGSDLFYVGLIGALPFLAIMLTSFIWGYISDRLGNRKHVIVGSMLFGSILFFLYPFIDNVIVLIILRSIQVCFYSSAVLMFAVATEYFPSQKGKVIGELNVPMSIGWVIGGGLSGYLAEASPFLFFITCGVTGLMISLILLPIQEVKKESIGEMLKNMFKFKKRKDIIIVCVVTALLFSGNYGIFSIFAVYMEHLGVSWRIIGLIVAASGIAGIPAVIYAGRLSDRIGRKKVLIYSILSYFFIWVGFYYTTNLMVIVILWILPIWAFYVTSSTAMISDITDKNERGRGIGILNSAMNLGACVGSISGGIVGSFMGYKSVFLTASAVILASFILSMKLRETLHD